MIKKYIFTNLFIICLFILPFHYATAQTLGTTFFNTAADNASNYGSWGNGDNLGSGFGTWTFIDSGTGTRGHYLGSSGQGDPSFAVFSDGIGIFAAAERTFSSALKLGDRFSADLGHSSTINGEIFIQLLDDGVPIITLKFVGGDSEWKMNDGGSDFSSGQPYDDFASLTFTFTYNEDGTYSYSFGSGSGNNISSVNTISGINSFKFQSTNQGAGQNFGVNNLSIDSKYTITGTSSLIVSSDTSTPYLTVESGSSVSVNSGIGLTVSGDLSNSGILTTNSGSSLIVGGTSSGNITYNRTIPTGGTNPADFYLISTPVIGQDIDAFAAVEGLAVGTGNNRGLGDYNNSTPGWEYYQAGASGTGNFISGDGRALSLAAAGDVSFSGTMPVSDVGIPIASSTNGYNLIGNPYPSYIAANDPADGTNNLLKVNDTDNDFLTESTIWLWDESTDSYDVINHTSAFYIAPAQGFFVSSNGSHTFSFTEAMQSHQSSDSFQRIASDRPEIQLVLTDGSTNRDTDIYYINGTTTGFDNGYDSSIFGGEANSFAVYTHAVANSQGRDLGIQSLPDSNFETMIIPVGVNAVSGSTLSFTAQMQNLPQGIHVYLEDILTNTFTKLNSEGGEYNITLNNDQSGIGRFYLRTTSQALGFDNVTVDHVSIYANDDKSALNIVGLDDGKASLMLFDLTGKIILNTAFQSNRFNTVSLPALSGGIYILKLQSENGSMNKKIMID